MFIILIFHRQPFKALHQSFGFVLFIYHPPNKEYICIFIEFFFIFQLLKMFHVVKKCWYVVPLMTTSMLAIFPIDNLTMLILCKRLLFTFCLYNIFTFFALYLIHIQIVSTKKVCLICESNPQNFLTSCIRCKKSVCSTCYVNISIRSLQAQGYKFICPFCRNKTEKKKNLSTIINHLEFRIYRNIFNDFFIYIYTIL